MSIITVSIPFPGGTATMADSTAIAIAAAETARALHTESLWGTAGLAIPGSPICMMQVQAQSLNDMATLMASMSAQQKEMIEAISSIRTSLAGVSSHLAAGVTTQQVALTQQIKNDKFTQQTTNAALERAELPPTKVLPDDLAEDTVAIVKDVTMVKGQIYVGGLVEDSISKATTWTTTIVTDYISESFIGVAAGKAKQAIKTLLGITDPGVKESAAEIAAGKRNIRTIPDGPSAATTPTETLSA
jgi:hypothetical protein